MANKDALVSGQQQTVSKKHREKYEHNIKKISKEILDIYDNYKNKDIKIRNSDEISSYILKKMDELNNRIDLELRKKEYKSIARSFVGRYPLYIMKLMYQNCMLRNSAFIELEDVASAFDLIMKSYTYLENWLQDTLKVDKKRMENQISIIRIVNKEISVRKKGIVRFNDVVRALITKGYMSKDRANLILKDELTYGPRSLFVVLKKGNEKFIAKRGAVYDHDVFKNLTDEEF